MKGAVNEMKEKEEAVKDEGESVKITKVKRRKCLTPRKDERRKKKTLVPDTKKRRKTKKVRESIKEEQAMPDEEKTKKVRSERLVRDTKKRSDASHRVTSTEQKGTHKRRKKKTQ